MFSPQPEFKGLTGEKAGVQGMRVSLVRSAAIAAGVLTGIFGPSAIDSGRPGFASAQAKEYYTKKRVNGRWISGRFAKRSAAKAKTAARAAPVRDAARPKPVQVAEAKPAAAPIAARATPPAALVSSAAALPQADGNGPAPAPGPATPGTALAEDGRMRQLQEALQARTPSLVVTVPAATPAPHAPPPQLQEALQARSRNILVTSLVDPAPAVMDLSGPSETASLGPVRATLPRADLRSVTFDFVTGVKTTVFGDGTTATEAFDPKAMRDLAARRLPAVN